MVKAMPAADLDQIKWFCWSFKSVGAEHTLTILSTIGFFDIDLAEDILWHLVRVKEAAC